MRLQTLVLIPALALSGCSVLHHGKKDDKARPEPLHLSVLVVNEAPTETLVIRDREGRRFATVFPGHSECVVLPTGVFSTRLVALPVGGGQGWMSPTFSAGHSESWEWRVGVTRTAAGGLDLMPTDEDCQPARSAHAGSHSGGSPAAPDTAAADTTKPPAP
ncbi:MAG: hypothetical protein JWM27_3576 [Gemmatimonadetes bacterium]|nr:hypothetical protein [Gemmatimonadota bacterium]